MSHGAPMSIPCEKQPFYTYRPLVAPKHSFRILELRPSHWKDDTIRGNLGPAITDGLAQYVALSYVWGPADDYDLIEIDNTPFRIRRNLFNCLAEYSRRIAEPAYLFVDAVCIDQTNTEERNAQVAIMGTIFRNAREVFIWLGADMTFCEPLFHLVDTKAHTAELLACVEKDRQLLRQAQGLDAYIPAVGRSNLTEAVRLFDFASASYLSCAWVFQEVLLARKLSINCGHLRASWKHISTPIRSLAKDGIFPSGGQEFLAMDKLVRTHDRLSCVPVNLGHRLREYMFLMRGKQCADFRDRFYGILGLLGLFNNPNMVEVNYTHSTLEVFLDALYYSMRIGAIQGVTGPRLAPTRVNLIRHLLEAFELQRQVGLICEEVKSDDGIWQKGTAEINLMIKDTSFLRRFAEKPLYPAGSANKFQIHTLRRIAYEAWRRSKGTLHVWGSVAPSIVLTDQSLNGLAVLVWLGRIGDEVAEDMVRLREAVALEDFYQM